MPKLPAISGRDLIRLLRKDGWEIAGRSTHGVSLRKRIGSRVRIAIVPDRRRSLPEDTLHRILSVKQTGIGKAGLEKLIDEYGL